MSITGKDLIADGWQTGKSLGLALAAVGDKDKGIGMPILGFIKKDPHRFLTHEKFGELAKQLIADRAESKMAEDTKLLPLGEKTYSVYGPNLIAANTIEQMEEAMRIPVARYGALMPDAHLGYGLPVGGVWALDNAVSPWAVGVDIACRMRLTVFEQSSHVAGQRTGEIKRALLDETRFGVGCKFEGSKKRQHPVLDSSDWSITSPVRRLKDTAYSQLGTSGGGNHFVEFGEVVLDDGKKHLALLSHSGSRGVGARIAEHYAKIAEQKTGHKLGWLDLDSEAGAEYWVAMNLAGEFAAANHQVIHEVLTDKLSLTVKEKVENHHNFAWKEEHYGEMLVVHRKGATPAGVGVWGVIPGTMADPGYVVTGKGEPDSLNSASHGAGRMMSRSVAKKTLDSAGWWKMLEGKRITLMGGSLDESPSAYKDINEVLALQEMLVEKRGIFQPKIVRMAEDKGAY